MRFEKPKKDVVPADWDKANGWKIPAIVWLSLDCGLRPVEVKRAKVSWVDIENERLIIPEKESSKNRENWKPPFTNRTAIALENWLDEREAYPKYDGRDELFLTREGNPYTSQSLKYVIERLFDVADIPQENRQVSWYMIRHSTGTYMAREEGLEAARQQLRHNSAETTMRYDQAPEADRRNALDRMG
jgi:integrase